MAQPFKRVEAGTTVQFTWVASDAPNSLSLQVLTASATTIASLAAVQSGGGMWYGFATIPASIFLTTSFGGGPCFLMAEWTATMSTHAGNSSPFINRLVFEVHRTVPWQWPR